MKVAVLGAGYAGLATALFLQRAGNQVTLIDSRGLGGGASGVSTGLLHPYHARKPQLVHRGEEAMAETIALIGFAEQALGRPVALRTGIMKSNKWIPEGITVLSMPYLEGLYAAFGETLVIQKILDLKQLDQYDAVVLANGHEILQFEECRDLPLKVRKGQALICRGAIPYSMIGNGHITLTEDPNLCQIGSTYEDKFDELKAYALREKVASFYPPARDFEVVEIRSGTRIAPKQGVIPLVCKINPKTWVFTGLGSRGLLYHALFGKELSTQILSHLNRPLSKFALIGEINGFSADFWGEGGDIRE